MSAPHPVPDPAAVIDGEKLFAARLHAAQVRPYLATALFALCPVPSWRVPTMGVDRHWRCYVSPRFVTETPVDQLAGVWVHEVSHLLRDHHGRSDRYIAEHGEDSPAERLRMNIAADCEINDDIYGDGLARPVGSVDPTWLQRPPGQLMEEYLAGFRLTTYSRTLAWLECGSGADGLDRPWELGPDGAHSLSEQERDLVRHRVARGVIGAPGTVPAGWRRWAERVTHPPQPWRALLGAALRAAISSAGAGDDYTYTRPSRRAAALPGVIAPSLRRVPPRVAVVVDTSGSVSDTELGSALLEIAAIGRAVGGRRDSVLVVPCDAAAGPVTTLCRGEDLPLVGGGGTDLRAGFAAALRHRPDVIVALTDGQTPWPRRPPSRTVIGLFDRPGTWSEDSEYVPEAPPAWARLIQIGDQPGR
ncbi:Predicted metal-dependent peptidase [Parafrankia irregularis]|uniref:Predicted metal-dependent peptidase n=1 Tax=Parafrankia irregularis TaxID=795642 RepID=A0A0S4QVF1_9ACTN|nr:MULTISPECIES: VWA-like domain-containing protein [Parafrankia]MBE3202476.1 hypothetical protein [Parafrankia sp. CH37]CUU59600.1 Predicted metal-dependent peptidase [Parafrankia irregularis]